MAIVIITHDLGVVAETADEIARDVRREDRRDARRRSWCSPRPEHPYTWGLLKSIPRWSGTHGAARADSRLAAEPDRPAAGLPLPPALPYAQPDHARIDPELRAVGAGPDGHCVACLLEPSVRRRLWAELREGRTPQEAAAASACRRGRLMADARSCGTSRAGRAGEGAPPGAVGDPLVQVAQPRQALPDHAGGVDTDARSARCRRWTASASRCAAARRSASSVRPARARARRPASIMRLLDATIGRDPLRRPGHHAGQGREAEGDAPRHADDLPGPLLLPESTQDDRLDVGEPFAIHGLAHGQGRAQPRGAGADRDRRPEPRALQPLPARVLGRPASEDRRRARARAETEAADRRRAGLGARRLDPGAGAESAAPAAAASSG